MPFPMFNTAPQITPPMSPAATQGQAGYNGAFGAGLGAGLSPLVQALMKAKLQQNLAGKFPGTTGQQANAMLPQTNSMMAGDPTIQALQNPSLGGVPTPQ